MRTLPPSATHQYAALAFGPATSLLTGVAGVAAQMERRRVLAKGLPLSRWYGFARGRWHKRRVYRSPVDLIKAVYLRISTPDGPGSKPPRFIRGLRIKLAGVDQPAWIRCGNSDFLVFHEIFEEGEYRDIARWHLPHDAKILDLGGNVGLAALYFGSTLPDSRIVVVEPDHENCQSIARNCEYMARSERVQIVEAFVAANDGSAAINRNARSWAFKMASEAQTREATERIRCISIPTLLQESGFDRVDLIKCDVEGAEAEIFVNCRNWIGRIGHLIVETHVPYRNEQLYADLRAAGWDFNILKETQEEKVGLVFLKGKTG